MSLGPCPGPYIVSIIIVFFILLILLHIFINNKTSITQNTFLKILNVIVLILFGFLLFFVGYIVIIYLILSNIGGSGLALWKQILIDIDILTIIISYILYFIMTLYFYSKSKPYNKIAWIILSLYILSSFPMFLLALIISIENCKNQST